MHITKLKLLFIVEPQYNEVPRHWQYVFVITGVHYIRVPFNTFYYTIAGLKNIVCYTRAFVT